MSTIIIDLESDRLLAVEASAARGRVRVHGAFSADLPESLSGSTDHAAIGEWIRGQLDSHGLRGKSAIVAVSRGEVLVKRFDAPSDTLDRSERHEMIRLQMTRQASMTSASSIIDYVEYGREGGHDGFIVASAMPTDRVEARRSIATAAGLRLEGIRLRAAGVRAMLEVGLEAESSDRPTLVINPGIGSAELLMLVGGVIAFSRSIEAPLPSMEEDAEVYAQRIAVEASRTLVSFRLSADGGAIDRAVVLAGGRVGVALASAIEERLQMPATTLDPSGLIDVEDGADSVDRAAIASLTGLLLCKARGISVHDFSNPTAPPDTTAGVRQAVLGGVFALILLAGVGFLVGQRTLASAERARGVAKQQYEAAMGKYKDAQLAGARLGHINAWAADELDWPAHLRSIVAALPDPDSVALAQIGVRLDRSPMFKPGAQLNDRAAWSSSATMSVTISGVARDRAHINDLRESLLDTGLYTVSSQGPEVADRFSMQIITGARSPDVAEGEREIDAAESAPKEGES